MDQNKVKTKIIEILTQIQIRTKKKWPALTGSIRPLEDLDGFDSKMCAPVITMLAAALGIELANDKNIFVSPTDKSPLTIDEAAALVCKMVEARAEATPTSPGVSTRE
jgi:hypothetical protein